LWYSVRGFDELYKLGYAESNDLINWVRKDEQLLDFNQNPKPYETEMIAFSGIIKTPNSNYMFYNGNGFGESGICIAINGRTV
jgi:hypothetical protein